jgi:hypothetical protein
MVGLMFFCLWNIETSLLFAALASRVERLSKAAG